MKKISILIVSFSLIMFLFSCGNKENNTAQNNDNNVVTDNTESNNNEVIKVSSNNEVDDNEPFDYLKKIIIDKNEGVFIKYNSASTTVINKDCSELDKNDPLYYEENMMGNTKMIKTQISSKGDFYNVVFSWGPSADPSFSFYKDGEKEAIAYISALKLYIPGNGNIYVSGHTNNEFNTRRKFTLKNGKFVETTQPYYYVGLKTTTLKAITLYENENLTNKVAFLPKDYNIEVFLKKKGTSLYLIKTDFGLTGWTKVENSMRGNETIKGLFYAGD